LPGGLPDAVADELAGLVSRLASRSRAALGSTTRADPHVSHISADVRDDQTGLVAPILGRRAGQPVTADMRGPGRQKAPAGRGCRRGGGENARGRQEDCHAAARDDHAAATRDAAPGGWRRRRRGSAGHRGCSFGCLADVAGRPVRLSAPTAQRGAIGVALRPAWKQLSTCGCEVVRLTAAAARLVFIPDEFGQPRHVSPKFLCASRVVQPMFARHELLERWGLGHCQWWLFVYAFSP
jgi:hypothetical protein